MISMVFSMALSLVLPQQVTGENGQTLAGQTGYAPNAFASATAHCGDQCLNRQDRIQAIWVLRHRVRRLVADDRCDEARRMATTAGDARAIRQVQDRCPPPSVPIVLPILPHGR